MQVSINLLRPEAELPIRASEGAAGYDLVGISYRFDYTYNVWIYDTGLGIELPEGFEAQVRARSSIYKTNCLLANGVGTIDSDYRGSIQLVFRPVGPVNPLAPPYEIGDRIGQLIVAPIAKVDWQPVKSLTETRRAQGGFGSTGR